MVTGGGYHEISNLISDHPIRNRIRITANPRIVGQSAASYNSDSDKIHLRSLGVLSTQFGPTDVVHECTHAQIDYRATSSSILSEESAAFIAETWFILASDMSIQVIDTQVGQGLRTIVQNLRSQSISQSEPVDVSATQINTMRSIVAGWGYNRHGHYTSNGIRGRRLR